MSCRTRSRPISAAPTSSSTSSPRTACGPARRSGEIDAGGDGDRERHARVAVIARDQQDEGRDEADADGDEPGDAGEVRHDRALLSRTAMTASLTPSLAIDFVTALSADVRAAAVLDATGSHLAGPHPLAEAARTLPDAPQLEGMTPDGGVFAARDERHRIVVVTGP